MKTRPGLVITHCTVILSGTGHVVDIDDVGGAFWYGCDDPETRWGDGVQYRRQRVGSREVRVFPPFIWAAGIEIRPRHEGRGRQLRWPDLRVIFLLICRRRGIPDLVSTESIDRVLDTTRDGRDGGTPTDVCLWPLF